MRTVLAGDERTHIPRLVLFSHPSCVKPFSHYLSHKRPARGCPHNFPTKSTTVSSMLCHPSGHLHRGRRNQIPGHSNLKSLSGVAASSILTWVFADTASLACPAHPDSLAITSRTFAAVICQSATLVKVETHLAQRSGRHRVPRHHEKTSARSWNCH